MLQECLGVTYKVNQEKKERRRRKRKEKEIEEDTHGRADDNIKVYI